MKLRTHIVLIMGILALSFSTGCASVFPGEDPVVAHAQSTINAAYKLTHAFVKFEKDNEVYIKVSTPEVHQLAESIRNQAPKVFEDAWAALDAYRTTSTPGDADTLDKKLARVGELAGLARKYLIQLNAKGKASNVPISDCDPGPSRRGFDFSPRDRCGFVTTRNYSTGRREGYPGGNGGRVQERSGMAA
jgi:hypothetical protein